MKKRLILTTLLLAISTSCSQEQAENTADKDDSGKKIQIKSEMPKVTYETEEIKQEALPKKKLSAEELKKYKPNELGWVMILEYHRIGVPEARWTRTPENFRNDLKKLYEHGYYLTPLRDFVNNNMDVPAGKSPVILTFDDGSEGQFRYLKNGDDYRIDPDSAVGIIEEFSQKNPDFGKAATFYVLPRLSFGQTPELAEKKLKFLAANSYEIGNHTLDHTNLASATEEQIKDAISSHLSYIHKVLPDYQVNTLAYPYGGVPKNLKLVENGDYNGTKYNNIAALLVGSNPSVSPNSKKFKPLLLPRIQAIQSELDKYFSLFKNYPGLKYISDGNKDLVSIPEKLGDTLNGTLKDDLKNSEKVFRYQN